MRASWRRHLRRRRRHSRHGGGAAGGTARAGEVAIVDGLPALGGQAVNSIIGTFCGLFSNGTHGYQFTYGVADDILNDLEKQDKALYYRNGPITTVVYYDEIALGRWVERAIEAAGIVTLVGAVLREVTVEGRRIAKLHFATRYGDVTISATGFVDATGDAALAWNAGLACREPADARVFGTQMVILENIDEANAPSKPEISQRMAEKGGEYGLRRREGLAFIIPGRGVAAMNMTHVETPLDPLEASAKALEGKDQADRAVAFLKTEFPKCFGAAKIRAYGFPGIRQTRWIAGVHQLTEGEVRSGTTLRRCHRPHGLADRAARPRPGPPLAHVPRGPRALHSAAEPRVARRRQPGGGRALHGRRRRGALQHARHGAVHGHGHGGGARPRHRRQRQRAPDRSGSPQGAREGQRGSQGVSLGVAVVAAAVLQYFP